jgi:hypothetical protein
LINITFTANKTALAFNGSCSGFTLQGVSVYGLPASTKGCSVVNSNAGVQCTVKEEDGVIEINNLQLNCCNQEGDTIVGWEIHTEEFTDEPQTTERQTTGSSTTEGSTETSTTESPTTESQTTESPTTGSPTTESTTTESTTTESEET